MPSLGLPELILFTPLLLIYFVLPVVSIVLVFLTYRKVSALEQRLARTEHIE